MSAVTSIFTGSLRDSFHSICRVAILIALTFFGQPLFAQRLVENDLAHAGYRWEIPLTPESAGLKLSKMPLGLAEGIWYSPADDMILLILRDRSTTNDLGVFILQSDDCRLEPGMRIGTMKPSADPSLYRLSLMTRYSTKKGLYLPLDATAKANSDFSSFTLETPKISFSLTPSVIIPNLLDLLRMRLSLRFKDPTSRLRDGWLRLYPHSSSGKFPIYL